MMTEPPREAEAFNYRRLDWVTRVRNWTGAASPEAFGTLVLVGAFFFLPLNGIRQIGGLPVGDLFLGLALIFAAWCLLLRRRTPPFPLWLGLAGLLLTAGLVLSELFSPLRGDQIATLFPYGNDPALPAFGKLLFSFVLLPVMVAALAASWRSIRLLAIAWVAGVSVSCIVAVFGGSFLPGIQAFLAEDPEAVRAWAEILSPARQAGLTAHPNSLAITTVLALPVLLFSIDSAKRFFLFFPIFTIMGAAVIMSGSRTGLVAFMIGAVGSVILSRDLRRTVFTKDPRRIVWQIGWVALLAFLVIQPINLVNEDRQSGGEAAAITRFSSKDRESAVERGDALRNSLDLIAQRPLTGSGFELIQATHNIYIQPLLAGGALTFLGFLLGWIGFLVTGLGVSRSGPPDQRSLAAALTLSISLYAVMGILINGMTDRFLYLAPALILALSVVSASQLAVQQDRRPEETYPGGSA